MPQLCDRPSPTPYRLFAAGFCRVHRMPHCSLCLSTEQQRPVRRRVLVSGPAGQVLCRHLPCGRRRFVCPFRRLFKRNKELVV